jgi:hypothetical protein
MDAGGILAEGRSEVARQNWAPQQPARAPRATHSQAEADAESKKERKGKRRKEIQREVNHKY